MNLDSSIKELKGVGDKTAKLFEKVGVYTIRDILLHFPYYYVSYPDVIDICDREVDEMKAYRAVVHSAPYRKGGPMQMVTTTIRDNTGSLNVCFFHMPYIKNTLKRGETYIFYGKVTKKNNHEMLSMPKVFTEEEYEVIRGGLEPKYHLTEGLNNNVIKKVVAQCIHLSLDIGDPLSRELLDSHGLLSKGECIRILHNPKDYNEILEARKRLAFEEFFFFLLRLSAFKEESVKTKAVFSGAERIYELANNLPFELTVDQKKALDDIILDVSCDRPMQRLLQGDVGSGKTIIAFLSMCYAAMNGYNSSLMAPTEVLATQHYDKLVEFIDKHHLPFKAYLLTGSVTAANKRKIKEAISNDPTAMVIGTHALIVEDVNFSNLGLVITDEQHRFGVRQRELLSDKGVIPHVLVMSATPIPRTLAIILYGDLSVSLIKSMPSNRLPIKNCVVGKSYRKTALEFIKKEVLAGRQAYVVCPLVEESEGMDAMDVLTEVEELRAYYGDEVSVNFLHGKMKPKEKNDIMERFSRNEINVLVSTTVIEVGVDVPNATVMMVDNAERFGLAQLHQLRGRVGRGGHQSYCIFFDGKGNKEGNPRLKILNDSNDGFYIAEKDLELRGPGDLFGVRQSGEFDFQVADIYHDADLLKEASNEVNRIIKEDPELIMEEHRVLLKNLNL